MAVGELNGDGKLDVAVVNNGGASVSVLLGLGNGAFAAAANYTVGLNPSAISAADLNGDGTIDLAVTAIGGTHVLLNRGDGTFAPAVIYPAGGLVTPDLNGDGTPDLVDVAGVDNGREVRVLFNHGDGTFATPVVAAVSYLGVRSIATADLNGDGATDLAIADDGHVIAVLNQGDGTFAAPASYATGLYPSSIAAADLNGDGMVDLATANSRESDGGAVSVLLNRGDGSFAAAVSYYAGPASRWVKAADLSGDGSPDLVVAQGDTMRMLLNQGDGTFAAPVDYAEDWADEGAIGDLNGDGRLDVVVSNGYHNCVSVLLNRGDGALTAPVRYQSSPNAVSVAAADLNGDGKTDLAVASEAYYYPAVNVLDVLLNQGDGTFAPVVTYDTNVGTFAVVAADLNGDGKTDLAALNRGDDTREIEPSMSVLLNRGDGTFAAPVRYNAYAGGSFVAADVNDDGKVDLIVDAGQLKVLLNRGDATFAPADYNGGGGVVKAADLNGDGKVDLAVARPSKNDVSVLLNRGDGTFTDALRYPAGGRPQSLAAADLNGDGATDIAVANTSSGGNVSVLLNRGDGTFAAPIYYAANSPLSIAAVDLNGDGATDLAVASHDSNAVSVLLNRGDGTFAAAAAYAAGAVERNAGEIAGGPESIAAADLNGDGRLDLTVASGFSNTVSVLFNACL